MGRDSDSRGSDERLSRRHFTTALGAGAGALALGAGAVGSAAARQEKSGQYDTLDVSGGDFLLQVNPWGSLRHNEPWDQTIWTESDGSFGYEWQEGASDLDPNYPEAMIGAKPWGPESDAGALPVQRGDVDEFEVTVDIDSQISGSNWNLALEWWLSDQKQPNGGEKDYEIMLVLDVGDSFGHDNYEDAVYTDKFGNTVDWWGRNISGGTGADFHQFYVSGGLTSGSIDLKRLVDFVESRLDPDDDLWLSGVEIGNEYYTGVSGETTFNQFDVTINGTTYTSGPDGGSGGGGGDDGTTQSPYSGPHTVPGRIQAEDFDTGGQGVAYNETDGNIADAYRPEETVDIEESTEAGYNICWVKPDEWWEYTVEVDTGGTYTVDLRVASNRGGGDFTVSAGDQEISAQADATGGWQAWETVTVGELELDAGTTVVRITSNDVDCNLNWFEASKQDDDGGSSSGLVVNDFDTWADGQNELGNWTGAGSFENGSGEIDDGDLKLDYNNSGWMGTIVNRDIGDYSDLVLSVRGATGDETDHLSVDWKNGRTNLADLTDDTIGSTTGDVVVPLDAIGVDESSPGQLTLEFWQGADSTIYIDEIRLV